MGLGMLSEVCVYTSCLAPPLLTSSTSLSIRSPHYTKIVNNCKYVWDPGFWANNSRVVRRHVSVLVYLKNVDDLEKSTSSSHVSGFAFSYKCQLPLSCP